MSTRKGIVGDIDGEICEINVCVCGKIHEYWGFVVEFGVPEKAPCCGAMVKALVKTALIEVDQ